MNNADNTAANTETLTLTVKAQFEEVYFGSSEPFNFHSVEEFQNYCLASFGEEGDEDHLE